MARRRRQEWNVDLELDLMANDFLGLTGAKTPHEPRAKRSPKTDPESAVAVLFFV
jgi:hypothetical protein